MKNLQNSLKNNITLEIICQQKAKTLAEIEACKERMVKNIHEIFRPSEAISGISFLINNLSSGMAIFDCIMATFKFIQRIRDIFRKQQEDNGN